MARNRRIPRLRYRLWHLMVGVAVLAGVFAVVSWWVNDPVGAAAFRLRYGWASARASAASALGDMGTDGRTAVALAQGLRDRALSVRAASAWSLARMAPSAREDVLASLHEALRDKNEFVRSHVLVALGRQGARAAPAVPEIVKLLGDEGRGVRVGAAHALGAIRSRPSEAVPALVDGLGDDDAWLRLACAKSLKPFGPDARSAAPALVERLDDVDSTVQDAAKRALVSLGRSRELTLALVERGEWGSIAEFTERGQMDWATLSEVFRDGDERDRSVAIAALGDSIGPDGAGAAPAIVALLEEEDRLVRSQATRALCRLLEMGLVVETARPALFELLDDDDGEVSLLAAAALLKDMGDVEMVLPTVLRGFDSEDAGTRRRACWIANQIGPRAAIAEPQLLEALQDEDRWVRRSAIYALKSVAGDAPSTVRALAGALEDESVCMAAAVNLGEMGPRAREAVPALRRALEHPEDYVRDAVARALRAIALDDPPGTNGRTVVLLQSGKPWLIGNLAAQGRIDATRLSEYLRHRDGQVRAAVVSALGEHIGYEGAGAAAALVELLEDEDSDTRWYAARALARLLGMSLAVETARPALEKLLDDGDWRVSLEAARALWKDQGDVELVLPTLVRYLKSNEPLGRIEACSIVASIGLPARRVVPALADALKNRSARFHAVYALRAMGGEAAPAVAALVAALDDGDWLFVRAAALALGEIGPEAREAVPALRQALGHREQHVREAAAGALRAIGGEAEREDGKASGEEALSQQ